MVKERLRDVVKQVSQAVRLTEKDGTLVDKMEDAYKGLESNHKLLSLTEAHNEFARTLIEYRDAILYYLVSASVR